MIQHKSNNISSTSTLKTGDEITVLMHDGKAQATIDKITK